MTDYLYYRKMENTSNIDLVDMIRENDERIEQLEQENEKLRENSDKAKEIIEGLMRFCRCFAQHHTEDIRYKYAEEYLKECE